MTTAGGGPMALALVAALAMTSVGMRTKRVVWRALERRCAGCGRRVRRGRICPCAQT
jgi:hypothetical protein